MSLEFLNEASQAEFIGGIEIPEFDLAEAADRLLLNVSERTVIFVDFGGGGIAPEGRCGVYRFAVNPLANTIRDIMSGMALGIGGANPEWDFLAAAMTRFTVPEDEKGGRVVTWQPGGRTRDITCTGGLLSADVLDPVLPRLSLAGLIRRVQKRASAVALIAMQLDDSGAGEVYVSQATHIDDIVEGARVILEYPSNPVWADPDIGVDMPLPEGAPAPRPDHAFEG